MTPEQYRRVGELYHDAMELAPGARSDFLARACGGEEELRREVESLLQAHEQADGFIAGKAAVVAELAAHQQNLSLSSLMAPSLASSLAPSLIGHSVSHYQVLSLLGAGGMGEVYLAQDTRLRRKVALKLLPQIYAQNQEWLRRFQREALTTSSLNHPNILTVYDIGTTPTDLGGRPFIVAELLEGGELRKEMKAGPLPVRKAIDYARQIAGGLAAAHEKGIVHRDLKPENLFVTKEGLVKILDFGLAKLSPQYSVPSGPSLTTQKQITNPGTVMGTVGYMSPEQVRGQEADHHSDIFSFGLILYEMLAGRRAFQGESSAETMAAIVNQEAPEISEINSKIPLQLERIVSHCLEKQPARRFQTASDLGFALEALLTPSGSRMKEETASSATQTINELPRWIGSEKWWIVVTALAMVLAAGFTGAYFIRPSVPDAQPMKLELLLSEKTKFNHLAVSPDGAWLAFTTETGGAWKLWALALATGEARPLEGAEGAKHPFWSPDSRFIGFFTSDKLKKIAISGGLPVTLCDFPGANSGTWNRDGVIIFATLDGGELYRVSATGGPVVNILQNDLKREELVLRFPSFLPDGHHFLYSVASNNKEVRGIYLGSLDGGTRERLLGDYSNAIYVASGRGRNDNGYLLFGHEKVLMAQPFDAKTLRLGGEPVSVAGQIGTVVNSVQRNFSASDNGVLVFDSVPNRQHKQLLWVDRAGKTINTLKQFDDPRVARVAPNGKHFVVTNYDLPTNNFDLWLSDVTDSNAVRLTLDPGNDTFPIWSPDASRVAWSATRGNDKFIQIYQKPVNRTGQETLLSQSDYNKTPTDWSRDGRYIIYRQVDPKTKNDIWALPLFGEQQPFPLLQSAANESAGSLSPDGRWLAYHSDESGRYEIYVQSFLDGSSKHRVSTGGGVWPYWRGDGKELYYRAPDDTLMAAPVTSQTSLAVGAPVVLFAFRTGGQPDQPYYSADRGGQRFLLNAIVESETNPPLTVLVNWMAVMKK